MTGRTGWGAAIAACGVWAAVVTRGARRAAGLGVALGLFACAAHAATPPFRPPQPLLRKLPNGVTVAVFRDARLPLVQVQLTVGAGSAAEDTLPAGVAYVTSQMVGQRTSSRDPQAMLDDLERAGGRMSTRVGRDVGVVTATFLASELPSGIDVIADAVENAVLADAELASAKRNARSLVSGPAQAAREGEDRLWRAAIGDGPYGRPAGGTAESLDRLTLADVRVFFNAHWGPTGALIAVAGDVQPDSVFALVEDAFGHWSARTPARAASPAPTRSLPARAAHVVSRPGAKRCELWVAAPGPAAGEPDEIAIALAHQLASRSAAGPGGLRGGESALRSGGFVWFATEASAESLQAAARRLESALTSLGRKPPGAGELDALKGAVQSTFPMRLESLEGLADQWSAEAALGRGFDDLMAFPARVGALTPDDISAAARKWFDPAHLTFVVAGPPDAVKHAITPIAPVAADGETGATPVTPQSEKRGRELVTKALAAHGGLAALRKVRDSVIEADATVRLGTKEGSAKIVQMRKEPDRMVYDLRFESAGTREVLIGDRAWKAPIDSLNLAQDTDRSGVTRLQSGFRADVLHLLLDSSLPTTRLVALGPARMNARTYDRVESWTADGAHRTLFFDPTTRLLAGVELQDAGEIDATVVPRRWYRDYRAVEGIQLPFEEDRRLGDEPVMDVKVTRYELNAGVPDALFERPAPPLPPASR